MWKRNFWDEIWLIIFQFLGRYGNKIGSDWWAQGGVFLEVDLCKCKHSSAEMKMYDIPQLQSWAEFLNVGDLGNRSLSDSVHRTKFGYKTFLFQLQKNGWLSQSLRHWFTLIYHFQNIHSYIQLNIFHFKSDATLSCELDFVVLGNLIKIIFVSKWKFVSRKEWTFRKCGGARAAMKIIHHPAEPSVLHN